MEWLLGALVGGAIGLCSALAVTEYSNCRARQDRKVDYSSALHTEISLAIRGLKHAQTVFGKAHEEGSVLRPAGTTFTRDVYSGCIGDLALLPQATRAKVQNFYACLKDVEFLTPTQDSWEHMNDLNRKFVLGQFVDTVNVSLQRADETLGELDELASQRPSRWRCIVGR